MKTRQTYKPSLIKQALRARLHLLVGRNKTGIFETDRPMISSDSTSEHVNDDRGECLVFDFYYPSISTLGLDSVGNVNTLMNLYESIEKEI